MGGPGDKKALTVELFNVTGVAVPEDDPIVTGALFFSYKLGEAGRLAAQEISEAGRVASLEIREAARLAAQGIQEGVRKPAQDSADAIARAEASAKAAADVIEKLAGERAQFLKTVEAQIAKGVKLASKGQAGPVNFRHIPLWSGVVGALVGALALAGAWLTGIEQGTARAQEAAVGRSFARAVPTMDPKLRAELMEHLRKSSR